MFEGEKTRFWIPEKLAYEGKSAPYGHARLRRRADQDRASSLRCVASEMRRVARWKRSASARRT